MMSHSKLIFIFVFFVSAVPGLCTGNKTSCEEAPLEDRVSLLQHESERRTGLATPSLSQTTGNCAEDLDKSDCEAAAKSVLLAFSEGDGSMQDTPVGVHKAPPGCYQSAKDKHVYYNNNRDTGECSKAALCLCKRVSSQGALDISLIAEDPPHHRIPRCDIDPLFGSELWQKPCTRNPNMMDCFDFMQNRACVCNKGFEYKGNPILGGCEEMVVSRAAGVRPHCERKLLKSEIDRWFKKPCTQYANMMDCDDGNGAHSCQCEPGFSHNWRYQCVKDW
eukprot:TRINITY_DN80827_c0_g1_i1.p1 TRINITY_DN80827_c0_g1~~TRINITY_DN80827_c0_g1_i1.p1  ORF type:complete len:277 (+),score=35.73 TRINITY_DN80827_c0_g1_i1:77-907(+)